MKIRMLLLFFLLIHGFQAERVKVDSKLGEIRGITVECSENKSIKCPTFLGVPFAKPPIGSRRFQKPEPIGPRPSGFDATSGPPECNQIVHVAPLGGLEKEQSEDCLYLNVVLPPTKETNGKYPVMVWFHGGGFVIGSISAYLPDAICGNLASRDVIVVSVQYRLGIFGFLALEGGNWGLHDQILALRWIKENIESFGGDPDRVTIFGESAGAVSVSLLTYIPEAQPLFAQGIAQSGSAFAYWGLNHKALHASRRLARALNCEGTPAEQVQCLRGKSVEQIKEAHLAEFGNGFWGRKRDPNKTYVGGGHETMRIWSWDWVPMVDGDLFPTEDLGKLLENAPPKPFITGVNELESHFIHPRPLMAKLLSVTEDQVPQMIMDVEDLHIETFEENLLDALSILKDPANFGTLNEKRATKDDRLYKVAHFIFLKSQKESPENKTFLTEQLIRLNSDFFMNLPCIQDAVQKKKAGHPVWLYNYKFIPKGSYPEDHTGIQGASHADDLIIFNLFPLDKEGLKVRDRMCEMWTDFAKTGVPTTELEWPHFESLERPTHLEIDKELSVNAWDFHRPNIPLWAELASLIERAEQDSPGEAHVWKQEL